MMYIRIINLNSFRELKLTCMKLQKTLVGLICSVTIFTACQKDYTPDLGSTAPDYFPMTANSYWSYTLDITGDTALFTATSNNVTISGNSYRPFRVSSGTNSDSLYYRKDNNGTYYEYGSIDFLGVLDTVGTNIDYAFLKDNVAANTTWESAEVYAESNGVKGKAKAKFTIAGKDIQQTINGALVDSIIKVTREILFKPTAGATFSSVNSMNAHYAKNKGLLLADGTVTLPPPLPVSVPFKLEAKRYKVY
jgi:hypothetical protein